MKKIYTFPLLLTIFFSFSYSLFASVDLQEETEIMELSRRVLQELNILNDKKSLTTLQEKVVELTEEEKIIREKSEDLRKNFRNGQFSVRGYIENRIHIKSPCERSLSQEDIITDLHAYIVMLANSVIKSHIGHNALNVDAVNRFGDKAYTVNISKYLDNNSNLSENSLVIKISDFSCDKMSGRDSFNMFYQFNEEVVTAFNFSSSWRFFDEKFNKSILNSGISENPNLSYFFPKR